MIHINVIIADRPYPLKIKRNEEENVRKAAKEINDKVKEYQQVYAAKDKQDYLAMTALMYAVREMNSRHQNVVGDMEVRKSVEQLKDVLARALADS